MEKQEKFNNKNSTNTIRRNFVFLNKEDLAKSLSVIYFPWLKATSINNKSLEKKVHCE